MKHEEDSLQMQCVAWFGWQFPELWGLLHHSPNGGKRNIREAQRFKRMGVQAGFPDLVLMVARSGFHALCVELKARIGRQSDAQKAMQARLEGQGFRYVIVRSLLEFTEVVRDYLNAEASSGHSGAIRESEGCGDNGREDLPPAIVR